MIKIYNLAEKIYNSSLFLKGQKSTSLVRKANREKWLEVIAEMYADVTELGEILDYSYSEEYFELIEEMKEILYACESCLRGNLYRYEALSVNYMQAFHNLPRAFFSPENDRYISVAEARKYAAFWLENGVR